LEELLDGIVSKDDTYRYNCFKVLVQISENEPLVLYPEWDRFVGLLGSPNAFHRSISVQIIAGLTGADTEKRFDDIFDLYFGMLDDEKVVVARYLAQNAWKIARSKPYLLERTTERLLDVDETHHTQSRKDLIKADVIQSFEALFDQVQDKKRVLAFVEQQLESSSPKARKAAKSFLKDRSRQNEP
jgi:hypothetical protein